MLKLKVDEKMQCPHCLIKMEEQSGDYVIADSYVTMLWSMDYCFDCDEDFEVRLEDEDTVIVKKY